MNKRKRLSVNQVHSDLSNPEDDSNGSRDDIQAQILLLENEIFESRKNYNNVATLLNILESSKNEEEKLVVASISLCRIFTRFMISGVMTKRQNATEKEAVVVKWLREQYSKYKNKLIYLLGKDVSGATILTLCMRLLKTEGQYLLSGQDYSFPTPFLTELIRSLLSLEDDEIIKAEFSQKFMEEYDDVRFYTFEAIEKVISAEMRNKPGKNLFHNCLQLLASVESIPTSNEELTDFYIVEPQKKTHALYSLSQHKKRAQAAWLALMRLEMNKPHRKLILKLMADSIVPWFIIPEILMDFLTDCYNVGGSISLLALSGVFHLIQEKNLDYPLFYNKLYSLLDAALLHSKHRSKFFRLLSIFLGSTHLPAALVASFIKRLSRLTLNAPPSGIIMVIPWIYNLLKKHPQCTFMIHREVRGLEAKKIIMDEGIDDPFVADEEDPMKTKAIDSSLWEIVMLQSHYHPNVATLAKILSEQFTKQSYNIEDFLDHSYGSMLEAEHSKEVKKAPVVEFKIPANIFTEPDEGVVAENDLLTKIWSFQ
ncbi:Uncharacterized protein GcC1_119021 [Golovinomyces cichoracearum]|uniref:CCAAT-binding factor domain-containing protein n=1 Tax=Golovinomyces cichoracearum TaxID=62708 RepID=A0A420I742_9PEZI|nr:Uncharacterized protein GcC1_119021 [Golovinomyces cichoracearum]